ncbi:MAG: hypothetical protein JSV18_05045 [Candidatus Bathyarchaeota archaeon]|nr:MAG: hypothetical protein JSV18_05045 [Candidatus Bathyarchaeota archaeon]
MVYCTKCGVENEDDALNCKNCGESLKPRRVRRYRRRDDDLCFGPRGGSWIGVFIGLLIIVAGVSQLFQGTFWWASWDRLWPFLVILFGLMIVVSVVYRRR